MDPFEYAMGLISIVVGLAVGDMATSLHKLIRHRRTIVWDARVLLAAAAMFILLFCMWYELWNIHRRPEILGWVFLLSLFVELVVAFLAASTAFPDDPGPGFDLAAFYEDTSRSLWTIYALFQVSYLGHWAYFVLTFGRRSAVQILAEVPPAVVPLATAMLLIRWPRHRWLHLVVVPALLVWTVVRYLGERITALT